MTAKEFWKELGLGLRVINPWYRHDSILEPFRPVSYGGVVRSCNDGPALFKDDECEKLITDFLIKYGRQSRGDVIVNTPSGVYWMPR